MTNRIIAIFLLLSSSISAQDSTELLIHSLLDSGLYYVKMDIVKAEVFYTEALNLSERLDSDSLLAETYIHLGILNRKKGAYSNALSYYEKSLNIHLAQNDSIQIATDFHNIAVVFRYLKTYSSAEEYFKKAIDIKEKGTDSIDLAISYSQLGVVYRKMEKLDDALLYNQKALKIFKQLGADDQYIHTRGSLAKIYFSRKEYHKSIAINVEAIAYFEETNQKISLANRCNMIGEAYQSLKQYRKAIPYMNRAINIATSENHLDRLQKYHKTRSALYYEVQNFAAALKDFELHKKYYDKVNNIENVKQIERTVAELKISQQKALDSLTYLQKEEQLVYARDLEAKRKNIFLMLFLLVLTVLGLVYFVFERRRKIAQISSKNKALEAELLKNNLKISKIEASRLTNENQIKVNYIKVLLSKITTILDNNSSRDIEKTLNGLSQELRRQIQGELKKDALYESDNKLSISLENRLINQFPSLTKAERQLCGYIFAKMSTKDIIDIKETSETSIRSMRYRIRKKIGLSKGEELEQFITNLFK